MSKSVDDLLLELHDLQLQLMEIQGWDTPVVDLPHQDIQARLDLISTRLKAIRILAAPAREGVTREDLEIIKSFSEEELKDIGLELKELQACQDNIIACGEE